MAQSKINIPATGTGDAGPVPVAVKKLSTGESVQQVELATAVEGGAITPIAAGNPLPVVQTGTPSLPTGASTAAKQPALGTAGASSSDVLSVQGIASGTALPVSAASLPLPSGASTAAGLTTINSTLGSPLQAGGNVVVTGTVPLPSGAATAAKQPGIGTAGSGSADVITVQGNASGTPIPVSATLAGTADVATTATITTTGSTTLTGLSGLSTLILSISSGTQSGVTDLIEGSNDGGTTWATLGTTLNGANTLLFSSLAAVSGNYMVQIGGYNQVRYRVVAITSGTYNIALRASAGVTNTRTTLLAQGTNTIGALSPNQSVNVAQVNGTNTPTNNGVVTAGTQRVTIASDSTGQVKLAAGAALVGSVSIDQTTPGTTNAVSPQPISITPTLTQVAGSATSVTIIAANATRKASVIVNESTAVLKVAFAASATTSAYTYLIPANSTLELPVAGMAIYTGLISGIWASATGNAVVTDMS